MSVSSEEEGTFDSESAQGSQSPVRSLGNSLSRWFTSQALLDSDSDEERLQKAAQSEAGVSSTLPSEAGDARRTSAATEWDGRSPDGEALAWAAYANEPAPSLDTSLLAGPTGSQPALGSRCASAFAPSSDTSLPSTTSTLPEDELMKARRRFWEFSRQDGSPASLEIFLLEDAERSRVLSASSAASLTDRLAAEDPWDACGEEGVLRDWFFASRLSTSASLGSGDGPSVLPCSLALADQPNLNLASTIGNFASSLLPQSLFLSPSVDEASTKNDDETVADDSALPPFDKRAMPRSNDWETEFMIRGALASAAALKASRVQQY